MKVWIIRLGDGRYYSTTMRNREVDFTPTSNPELASCWREDLKEEAESAAFHMRGTAVLFESKVTR